MQRKALKQLGKVTQWTNEKVFSGEKTSLSDDFTEYEKEVDVRRIGIERLHGTSLPFFQQLTKVKPTGDPYPPSGSGKEKILHTEALGLVMSDYGGDVGGVYGDGLGKYGRARCKLAIAQEEFGARLSEGYIGGMGTYQTALAAVNDYKTFRKKLDSRRLALDSAISRLQGAKKEKEIPKLEMEVEEAKERFEEIEEETKARLAVIQEQEERQWSELTDLLEAEYEYFAKCKDILEDLRSSWPTGEVSSVVNRPRAKSNASARSLNRQATTRNFARASSEDEDADTPNRSRSQSNASSTGKGGGRRSMLPSFGSLGKKGGLASMAGSSSKRKSFGKEKERYTDESRQALHSDADDDDDYEAPRSPLSATGRTRSQTTLSTSRVSLASGGYGAPPPMRRTHTTPVRADSHYVKALYDFAGGAADELSVRAGDIIEVKQEVSAEWYIGESSGRSGLFPVAYCEEYVPTPTTARAPPMPTSVPTPRNLPPPAGAPRGNGATRAMPPMPASHAAPASLMDPYATSDSELEHGFSDAEHDTTAHLTSSGQAPASASRPAPSARKPAPPPPPSRRSQSSSNLLSTSAGASFGTSFLSPPQPSYARRTPSSPEGSPFAGSEEDEEEIFGGGGRARSATVGASPRPASAPTNGAVHSLSNGLGNLHLDQGAGGVPAAQCKDCRCEDFTQNVFKPKGTCSTCFHQH